jgi:hypothetical protein
MKAEDVGSLTQIKQPNFTIMSYNASAVKIYNAKSSLVRLENKDIFFYFE